MPRGKNRLTDLYEMQQAANEYAKELFLKTPIPIPEDIANRDEIYSIVMRMLVTAWAAGFAKGRE